MRHEGGYTLIELLVAVTVTAVIALGAAATTRALLINPQKASVQNTLLRQVQNTAYWVSRDIQMARTISLGTPAGFPLVLSIAVDADPMNDHSVTYSFLGDKMCRQEAGIGETFIAEGLLADNTSLSASGPGCYCLTVCASEGLTSMERAYEISQRIFTGE